LRHESQPIIIKWVEGFNLFPNGVTDVATEELKTKGKQEILARCLKALLTGEKKYLLYTLLEDQDKTEEDLHIDSLMMKGAKEILEENKDTLQNKIPESLENMSTYTLDYALRAATQYIKGDGMQFFVNLIANFYADNNTLQELIATRRNAIDARPLDLNLVGESAQAIEFLDTYIASLPSNELSTTRMILSSLIKHAGYAFQEIIHDDTSFTVLADKMLKLVEENGLETAYKHENKVGYQNMILKIEPNMIVNDFALTRQIPSVSQVYMENILSQIATFDVFKEKMNFEFTNDDTGRAELKKFRELLMMIAKIDVPIEEKMSLMTYTNVEYFSKFETRNRLLIV
jgi:hypothetical protein